MITERTKQTENGTAAARSKSSLKWQLVGIVLVCWIFPVLMVLGMLGYFINNNINNQISDTIATSTADAAKTCKSMMANVVAMSRNASYYPTVREAWRNYQSTGDRVLLYSQMYDFLTNQYQYDEKLRMAALFFVSEPENVYLTFNRKYPYNGTKTYMEKVHSQVCELSPTLDTGLRFISVEGSLFLMRNILGTDFKTYAVLVMELNPNAMFNSMRNVPWETDAALWLNGTEFSLSGETLQLPETAIYPGQRRLVEEKAYTTVYGMESTPGCDIVYAVKVNREAMMDEVSGFLGVFFAALLLTVPLLAWALRFFYRNISHPIIAMVEATRQVEHGELGYQLSEDCRNREMQYLADSMNAMSAQLKAQFDRIYSDEIALRDARIMALQSQINPHFLNNTLEIINWEARLAENNKVSQMIEALSTMLDAAMDRKGKPIVRLSDELMYVDAYLTIISERFGKRLTVHKEIDSSLLDCAVPRLILQPIIENAIEHGVQRRQSGVVTLRIFRDGDDLILEIENDGGMTVDDERHIEKLLSPDFNPEGEGSGNLGIFNVNQRIRIIYGEHSGLTITRTEEGHSISRIVLTGSASDTV